MVMSIKTEADYIKALKRIGELMVSYQRAEFTTWAGEIELVALVKRVEKYEQEHYPIDPPTPEEARKFREEQEATNGHD